MLMRDHNTRDPSAFRSEFTPVPIGSASASLAAARFQVQPNNNNNNNMMVGAPLRYNQQQPLPTLPSGHPHFVGMGNAHSYPACTDYSDYFHAQRGAPAFTSGGVCPSAPEPRYLGHHSHIRHVDREEEKWWRALQMQMCRVGWVDVHGRHIAHHTGVEVDNSDIGSTQQESQSNGVRTIARSKRQLQRNNDNYCKRLRGDDSEKNKLETT